MSAALKYILTVTAYYEPASVRDQPPTPPLGNLQSSGDDDRGKKKIK